MPLSPSHDEIFAAVPAAIERLGVTSSLGFREGALQRVQALLQEHAEFTVLSSNTEPARSNFAAFIAQAAVVVVTAQPSPVPQLLFALDWSAAEKTYLDTLADYSGRGQRDGSKSRSSRATIATPAKGGPHDR
jgi:hypothetical protein